MGANGELYCGRCGRQVAGPRPPAPRTIRHLYCEPGHPNSCNLRPYCTAEGRCPIQVAWNEVCPKDDTGRPETIIIHGGPA